MDVEQISATSACVLILEGGRVHSSPASRRFRRMLDLDPGRRFADECTSAWPHYDKVVVYRKWKILQLARDAVRSGARQVAVFGAGLDALSVELASEGARAFEVDVANMDAKARMLERLGLSGRVSCVTADMADAVSVDAGLAAEGWDPSAPTLLVFEGISYYVEPDALWGTVGRLCKRGRVILEYFLPQSEFDPAAAGIAAHPFNVISRDAKLEIRRYSRAEVAGRAEDLGGRMLSADGMHQIELARERSASVFPTPGSGWIEVCCFEMRGAGFEPADSSKTGS